MGVLDPIKENSSETQRLEEKYSAAIDVTLENFSMFSGAILNDRYEILNEKAPTFMFVDRDEDIMDIDTMEELEEECRKLKDLKQEIETATLESKFAWIYADKLDFEPDEEKPIESYEELDSLERFLDGLVDRVESDVIENCDVDPERFEEGFDIYDYDAAETFFCFTDSFRALPLIEGIVESEENIEREKERMLDRALEEHEEHRKSIDEEHDRVEIPLEPIDWEGVIGDEDLREYVDIRGIPTATYGDSLHIMMEDLCEDVDRIQPEYPLHFLNKGDEQDTPNGHRIDNTVQPDVMDDLFVYEFKHMPRQQEKHLKQNGDLKNDDKFIENVKQVNGYLNRLGLSTGMLVYVSSDMEIKEYVVERHEVDNWNNYDQEFDESFIHEKEDYDFSQVIDNI